jgi:hypothetical protein
LRKNRFDITLQNDFKKIPGTPIAYWASDATLHNAFSNFKIIDDLAPPRIGMITTDNERFYVNGMRLV